jgi:hypothetical protein
MSARIEELAPKGDPDMGKASITRSPKDATLAGRTRTVEHLAAHGSLFGFGER